MGAMRLMLISLLFFACKTNPPQAPVEPDPVDPPEVVEVPAFNAEVSKLAEGRPIAETLGCETNEDCGVTCMSDGACCGQLCGCTHVYNKSFLAEMASQREMECTEIMCPIASCLPPEFITEAVCVDNVCTAVDTPTGYGRADPSNWDEMPTTVVAARLEGELLYVDVEHGGGCGTQDLTIAPTVEDFGEGVLSIRAFGRHNGPVCLASITETRTLSATGSLRPDECVRTLRVAGSEGDPIMLDLNPPVGCKE